MNNDSNNKSYVKSYIDSWKRIFDYKGVSDRKDYWSVVIADLILMVMTFVLACVYAAVEADEIIIVVRILEVIVLLSMFPLIALTVRRLRDAGISEWWTCLIFVIGIGTIVLLFMCSSSSTSSGPFAPENNYPVEVYGPPEIFYDIEDEDANESDDIDEEFTITVEEEFGETNDVNGAEDANNPNGGNANNQAGNSDSEQDSDYIPELNVNEDVYGPPAFFDDGDTEILEIDDFDATINMNVLVYGPPEVFEDNQVDSSFLKSDKEKN